MAPGRRGRPSKSGIIEHNEDSGRSLTSNTGSAPLLRIKITNRQVSCEILIKSSLK